MEIRTIKLSEKAKGQLSRLKRKTGIEHWNVLCRWAFCLSLAEPSIPPDEDIPSDSSVEMSWRVFAGDSSDIYMALLIKRAYEEDLVLNDENILSFFRLHLHRGISYLASRNNSSINDLVGLLLV